MRTFHLACPYTSLAICHCRLFVSAQPRYMRNPFKRSRPTRGETAARRAQLLQLICDGSSQNSSASFLGLVRAMHARAAQGRVLMSTTGENDNQVAHMKEIHGAMASMADLEDEDAYAAATDRMQDAQDELRRAEEGVTRAVTAARVDGVDVSDVTVEEENEHENDHELHVVEGGQDDEDDGAEVEFIGQAQAADDSNEGNDKQSTKVKSDDVDVDDDDGTDRNEDDVPLMNAGTKRRRTSARRSRR